MAGQLLPAGMLASRRTGRLILGRLCLEWFALALGLHLLARYARLKIQQLQLQIAQRLAALAVPSDAVQAQALLQKPDLYFGKGKRLILASQLLIFFSKLNSVVGQLCLQLRYDLGKLCVGPWHLSCGERQDVLKISDITVDLMTNRQCSCGLS